jgi:hypothetical protein
MLEKEREREKEQKKVGQSYIIIGLGIFGLRERDYYCGRPNEVR